MSASDEVVSLFGWLQIDICKASACGSVNGKVKRGAETQERSRSGTTVTEPQAESPPILRHQKCRS